MEPISMGFMLSLQASGMVMDYFGKQEQVRLSKLGSQIEQAGINANIKVSQLESEDSSLQAMKQLRQNLGTQAAMAAARGIRSGTGAPLLAANESVGNFNADERMRKINQLGNEANLRAGLAISKLHQQTTQNTTWNQFRTNVANRFPTDPDAYKRLGSAFGLTKV